MIMAVLLETIKKTTSILPNLTNKTDKAQCNQPTLLCFYSCVCMCVCRIGKEARHLLNNITFQHPYALAPIPFHFCSQPVVNQKTKIQMQ